MGVDQARTSSWVSIAKRAMDMVFSIPALLLTVILFPFIAIAIKSDSPGPVIFRQKRVGANGKPFTIYKFRSMVQDAEERLAELIDMNNLESPVFKLVDDPRVTRVGRFLRRTSMDELPQFLNVLLGHMSLVGPRPEEQWVVALYSAEHRQRLAVKPGMTGPMQVNGRADLSLEQRLALELDYIANYSIWCDLAIMVKTASVLLSGKGAR